MEEANFSDLIGKTLVSISGGVGDEEMVFTTDTGERFKLYHVPDCCESVEVEDICGDLGDVMGSPVLVAEEIVSVGENPPGVPAKEYQGSFTWTFYKLSTVRGSVTIRWYGESNGYYSEGVDFIRL